MKYFNFLKKPAIAVFVLVTTLLNAVPVCAGTPVTVQYDGDTDSVISSQIAAVGIKESNASYRLDEAQNVFYYGGSVGSFEYTLGKNDVHSWRTNRIYFKPGIDGKAESYTGTLTNPYTITYTNAAELKNGRRIDMVINCTSVEWKAVRVNTHFRSTGMPAELDGAATLYSINSTTHRPMFEAYMVLRSGENDCYYRMGARQTFTVSFEYSDNDEPVDAHIAYSIFDIDRPDRLVNPAVYSSSGYTESIDLEGGQENPVHVVVPKSEWLLEHSGNHFYGTAEDDGSYKSGFVVNGGPETTWTWTGSYCGTSLDVAYSKGGGIRLHKLSSDPELTEKSDLYSLSGAVYTLYSDAACTKEAGFELTTKEQKTIWNDNEGFAATDLDIEPGDYYLKETKKPKGFALDTEVHHVTVEHGAYTDVTVTDDPARVHVYYRSDEHGTITGKEEEELNLHDHPTGSKEKPKEHYRTLDAENDPPAAWTCDQDVVLDDLDTGTKIEAGTPMTMEEIKRVIVTEDLIFTVHHEIIPEQPEPVKKASAEEAASGDVFDYTITQRINETGVNYGEEVYSTELIISDELPREVDYIEARASWTPGEAKDSPDYVAGAGADKKGSGSGAGAQKSGADVRDSGPDAKKSGSGREEICVDGGISYDTKTHTVTWSDYRSQDADHAFKKHGIDLDGGTVTIVITVRANDSSRKVSSWDNEGETFVDHTSVKTNIVTVRSVPTADLTISKSVAGNMADRSKEFAFTVSVSGAGADKEYPVKIERAGASGSGDNSSPNSSGGSAGDNEKDSGNSSAGGAEKSSGDFDAVLRTNNVGSGSVGISLSHKDRAVISDLPKGTVYCISEDAEGYEASWSVTEEGSSAEGPSAKSDSTGSQELNSDAQVSFVNVRRITIPTGLAGDSRWLDVLLAVLIAALTWKAVKTKTMD